MTDLVHPAVRESGAAELRGPGERVPLLSLLRKDVASNGPAWLPLVLVLGATAAVAYADHFVASISLVYLYILPLSVGAIFLRREVSYSFIVACILFHDYYSPRNISPGLRIFHNLSAMLCFAFVVYVIQRYMEQREALAKTVQQQRDDLLQDVKLAAQVQRLFLPSRKPAIGGLEISGMMHPARGVGGDYYDYIPIDAHTIQFVIADVAGKGVPAALLMSATAAAMRLEANHDRNMLQQVERLNTEIRAVSDAERYVTLLIAEIDTNKRTIHYVNCGHNPALLFRAKTGTLMLMNSSCPPIGLSPEEICELTSADLTAGDVVVFYTDGVTEAENRLGEEFGLERLSAVVRHGSSLSAEELTTDIFNNAANFCSEVGFHDDVTILVVKCHFNGSPAVSG
ncbi:MAG TPA: PP2C family protein-serine/threonine phosphatase [Candidatus Acidoferrum sp.]|nr:PP2C family protein-serine/threonine phosphatase [Candidatus Acidoferrum sp.]